MKNSINLFILMSISYCLNAQEVETRPGDPVIMEVAPYQPVKKESIKEKLERIVSDGNSVGLVVDFTNRLDRGLLDVGQDTSIAYLQVLREYTLSSLRSKLGIEAIELIDKSQLPIDSKMVMGTPMGYFNYAKTKYKVVFTSTWDIATVNSQDVVSQDWKCEYFMSNITTAYEYFIDPKKGKEKDKWVANLVILGYNTAVDSSPSGCDFSKLEISSQEEILSQNKSKIDEGIDKWVQEKYKK